MEEQRLACVRTFLAERGWEYQYTEEDGCGSLDFDYRGVPYHIWEYEEDGARGVETNLRHGGRQEEIDGDYEAEILEIMKDWH
ncbi:MAG: kinase [Lachnospiraceae bacterium]|nr:kinase [Lachnospiraceae bacterium]